MLEPDLPEREISTPTNSGTDLDSETTASTTEYEAFGGQAAVPNQIPSIVDPFIIEEARRRSEQDLKRSIILDRLFTNLSGVHGLAAR